MLTLDTVAWHAMVIGHVKCGKGQKSLELYFWQNATGRVLKQSLSLFFEALYEFTNLVTQLKGAIHVHEYIVQTGF